jgi:hypothetical protein
MSKESIVATPKLKEKERKLLEIILLERETLIMDGSLALQFGRSKYRNKKGAILDHFFLNVITPLQNEVAFEAYDREVVLFPNLKDEKSKLTRVELKCREQRISTCDFGITPQIVRNEEGRFGVLLRIQPELKVHMLVSGVNPKQVMHALTESH